MELFDIESSKSDTEVGVEAGKADTNVDKLKAFADVEDSKDEIVAVEEPKLDFDVDFEALDKINATQDVKPIVTEDKQGIERPGTQKVEEVAPTQKVIEEVEQSFSDVEGAKQSSNNVEKLNDILDKVDEYGDKAVKKLGDIFKAALKKAVLFTPILLSNYQDNKIHKKFEKGDLVVADNFQFLMYQGELMVYKYTGTSMHILVPDYVGNLPVRYVYKGFLNKNIFDNHKVRTVLSYFKDDNISDLSLDALKDSMTGIKSIQLPKELVYVPRNLFSGTGSLNSVIIPESVRLVSPSAFSKSNISKVYFTGGVPKNLKRLEFPEEFSIYCKPEYVQNFEDELSERRVA